MSSTEKDIRSDILEGRNPVWEAMRSGVQIDKLFINEGANYGSIQRILDFAGKNNIPVSRVARAKLDSISQTGAHQGIIAYIAAVSYVTVEDILQRAKQKNEDPLIVIADGIEDSYNLGSIIRSANCAGVHGVIIPKHRATGLSAACAKASAGAVMHTLIAKVTNISMTVEKLKKEGLWVAGTDAKGEQDIYNADLTGPLAIVIGSEGAGISRLVKEKCDFLLSIPLKGQINSLNASVSAALVMYEVLRQRQNLIK